MNLRCTLVAIVSLALPGCAAARTPASPPVTRADAAHFGHHKLMVPVDGVTPADLRDSFNAARGGGRIHGAIDILAPRGTPVVAATGGYVMRLARNPAGGITAYLMDESRKYVYYYAHLDHYSDEIIEGLKVRQGFVIGYVGTSGNAPPDTPHLHFQAMRVADGQRDWWNGAPVDVRIFMEKPGKAR